MKVSDREMKVLKVLAGHYNDEGNCLYFRTIMAETKLEKTQVRRSVRSLARKDLAKYERGLFDDDGTVAGSGYCCTRAGKELVSSR